MGSKYNDRAVLILGAGADQRFMIKTANLMGLTTVAVDADSNAVGADLPDFFAPIDFSNVPMVISYCRKLMADGVPLRGVCTMGSDVPNILAALSDHFGWIGPSMATAVQATDKVQMKKCFIDNDIPTPRSNTVISLREAKKIWSAWKCERIIIKPSDRSGSRGVSVVSRSSDLESAIRSAELARKQGSVLIEEFVNGRQISTETVVKNGECITPGFADRIYQGMHLFWPQILENGGSIPSSLDPSLVMQVKKLVESASLALGIDNGVAKGDVVICPKRGAMMIEMAARLSGGDFCESLVPLSSGVNYVKAALQIALGDEFSLSAFDRSASNVVMNRYFFPPSGQLSAIQNLDWLENHSSVWKLAMNCKIGGKLPIIRSHADRAGVFVLRGDDHQSLNELTEEIYQKVMFKIDGIWRSGSPYQQHHARGCT